MIQYSTRPSPAARLNFSYVRYSYLVSARSDHPRPTLLVTREKRAAVIFATEHSTPTKPLFVHELRSVNIPVGKENHLYFLSETPIYKRM